MPSAGYFIASKAAIKALTPSQRSPGYSRSTLVNDQLVWYGFVSTSTASADDESVLMPDDNPATGRWHKYAAGASGAAAGPACQPLCFDQCLSGGAKVWEFFAPYTNLLITVQVGFGMAGLIEPGEDSIGIYRWTDTPDISLTYLDRTPVVTVPHTGGSAIIPAIDAAHRYFSIFFTTTFLQYPDAACFAVNSNVFTLVSD